MSTWLLVGLGNPGPTYASHRHNVGYRVVDELARRAGSGFSRSGQLRAELVATRLTASGGMGGLGAGAEQIILLKPRTFMNVSGQSVVKALAYYKIPAERLVVVHIDSIWISDGFDLSSVAATDERFEIDSSGLAQRLLKLLRCRPPPSRQDPATTC